MEILTKEQPGRGKNCSHCSFQDFHSLCKENQVSLVRTFLSDPGSESKISRLGGWGWKNDPDTKSFVFGWPRAVAHFQTKSCKIVSHRVV